MRQDLAKLMVERPRGGGRIKIHRRKHNQKSAWRDGDAPSRGSMSRNRGTKWLSEYFSPLIRILRSQRGALWDEVYSEIAAQIRPNNVVQKHVLDHLFDFVIDETWTEGGRDYGMLYWGHSIPLDRPQHRRDLFYVCPRTRRLGEVAYQKSSKAVRERTREVRIAGPSTQIRRINGVWYAFELKPIPKGLAARQGISDRLFMVPIRDLLNSDRGRTRLRAAYGSADVYAASKRQLGKKEIRKIDRLPRGMKTMEVSEPRTSRDVQRKN